MASLSVGRGGHRSWAWGCVCPEPAHREGGGPGNQGESRGPWQRPRWLAPVPAGQSHRRVRGSGVLRGLPTPLGAQGPASGPQSAQATALTGPQERQAVWGPGQRVPGAPSDGLPKPAPRGKGPVSPTGCSHVDRPSAAPLGIGACPARPLVPRACHLLLATGNNVGPGERATPGGSGQLWTCSLAAALETPCIPGWGQLLGG